MNNDFHRIQRLPPYIFEEVNRIKARLPVWKREHGPDGPYWVGWQDARCGGEPGHGGHGHAHRE